VDRSRFRRRDLHDAGAARGEALEVVGVLVVQAGRAWTSSASAGWALRLRIESMYLENGWLRYPLGRVHRDDEVRCPCAFADRYGIGAISGRWPAGGRAKPT
jgi:hypothetical protein